MVKVTFTSRAELKGTVNTVFEQGATYDMSEASAARWEQRGIAQRVTDIQPDKALAKNASTGPDDSKTTPPKPADPPNTGEQETAPPFDPASSHQIVPNGKKKFDVIDPTGNVVNTQPLTKDDAVTLHQSLTQPQI